MKKHPHESYADGMRNLYANAARFLWKIETISEARLAMKDEPAYRRMPQWAKAFVDGVIYVLDKEHWKLVEYSYEINGVRYLLSDPKYRKFPAEEVNRLWTHTGAFAYKESPTTLFTKERGEP
jgi:hypothetical protein